jgi:hypothetical protein
MANNATWTIIDRGEPDSYFAIWDLVDYMGQGTLLKDQCQLLKETWEMYALTNSYGNQSVELVSAVMRDYYHKKQMFNFVQALIDCLRPIKENRFDILLCNQFEDVVKKGFEAINDTAIINPTHFIQEGFKRADDIDPGEEKFEVYPFFDGYTTAEEILLKADRNEWSNSFTYYTESYRNSIMQKGKKICSAYSKVCFDELFISLYYQLLYL